MLGIFDRPCAEVACISNPIKPVEIRLKLPGPTTPKGQKPHKQETSQRASSTALFRETCSKGHSLQEMPVSTSLHGARLIEACFGLQEPRRDANRLPGIASIVASSTLS